MGIADVRNALTEVLRPLGTPSEVRLSYRHGDRRQVVTFRLTQGAAATDEELILPPHGQLIPQLRLAAEILLANRSTEEPQ